MNVTACGTRNQEYMLEAFEKGEKNAIPFTLCFHLLFNLKTLRPTLGKYLHSKKYLQPQICNL